MGAIFEDITAAVGRTPFVRISKPGSGKATIFTKLQSYNPCGSAKNRTISSTVETAEKRK